MAPYLAPYLAPYYLASLSEASLLWAVHPTWGLVERRESAQVGVRSRGGALVSLWGGGGYSATVPLRFASAGLQEATRGWWQRQSRLAWVTQTHSGWQTVVVRLVNPVLPLGRREPGLLSRQRGVLVLAAIGGHGEQIKGAPLILDHAQFGTLNTHNVLL